MGFPCFIVFVQSKYTNAIIEKMPQMDATSNVNLWSHNSGYGYHQGIISFSFF